MSDALELSVLSTERVLVPVAGRVNGAPADVSDDDVALAFVRGGSRPSVGDWHAASWDVDDDVLHGARYAAALDVGPDGVDVGAGRWAVWFKLSHGSNTVVRRAGGLVVS